METFRYDQFCPLARAAEILGHRWVIPILRELSVGPQRFSDLRRRLPGLSSSVLADRLAALESQGVATRRDLPPPAAATVYELTETGRALEPSLMEMTRWGLRFLTEIQPGDHIEPDWLGLAVRAFARTDATPQRRFELCPQTAGCEVVIRVEGGESGTRVIEDDLPVDVQIRAPAVVVMALMSGALSTADATREDGVLIEGDVEAISDLADLFSMKAETHS